MARTIKLTEIRRNITGTGDTELRPIGIPLARIDHVEESSTIFYTKLIARDTECTKVIKVNGDYVNVQESLDTVIEFMNADDNENTRRYRCVVAEGQ